jgi:hypothetical protein
MEPTARGPADTPREPTNRGIEEKKPQKSRRQGTLSALSTQSYLRSAAESSGWEIHSLGVDERESFRLKAGRPGGG